MKKTMPDDGRVLITSISPGQWFQFSRDGDPCLMVEPPDGHPRPWYQVKGQGRFQIHDAAMTRVIPIGNLTKGN
jgi:hypothetical protein